MFRNKIYWLIITTLCVNNAYAKTDAKAKTDANVNTKTTVTQQKVNDKTQSSASDHLKMLLLPVNSLQGQFEQNMVTDNDKILQKLSGKMYLQKPGQFRWEILSPEPRLVVADGKKVWDYDKELDQVTVQKVTKGQGKAPIYFLTGEVGSLDKDFIITAFSSNSSKESSTKENKGSTEKTPNQICMQSSDTCFELKPKKEEGSFQWIHIGFKDKKINELELLDQLGQRSRFKFIDIQINEAIPSNIFQFTVPKGVDVLEN